MNFTIILQVISFLVANKEQIKEVILSIEALIPDTPGSAKAGAVKAFIGTALGIEAQIEAVWPLVSPIFNLLVGSVKASK